MKISLPILTLLSGLLPLGQIQAQTAAPDQVVNLPRVPGPVTSTALVSGQQMVADAAALLFRQNSVSARLRQRIDLFGQQLVGSGSYQQLGASNDKLLRLELKIQTAGNITSLQQVCDGRFLWTRRDLGDRSTLARVDLRRVNEQIQTANETQPIPGIATSNQWLALGGLPKLLTGLESCFQFQPPQATKLADVAVWLVEGTWRPHMLEYLLPEKQQAIQTGGRGDLSRLPQHLPDSVSLWLGQEDLFPYRVQFRRQTPAAKPTAAGDEAVGERAIVTLELFEVQLGAAIDPLHFVYKPGDQEVVDQTDEFLRKLNLAKSSP